MTDEMRRALDERRELIEARAEAVLAGALADKAPWTAQLGPEPKGLNQGKAWRRAAAVVAAYRDRYQVTDDRTPLGPAPRTTRQKIDAARACAALDHASAITSDEAQPEPARPVAARPNRTL